MQVWCAPSFENCIEQFSLVKTLLTIDKSLIQVIDKGGHQGKRLKGFQGFLQARFFFGGETPPEKSVTPPPPNLY